jgi:PAS domain S-box-containing protein
MEWLENYAPQGILLTDDALVIQGWNRWLEVNTGLPAQHLIGRQLLEVFPELVERNFARYYTRALNGESIVLAQRFHRYLLRMPAPDGIDSSDMQQTARIAPLLSGDKIMGTVTVVHDVTERVVHESELQSARFEAERANQSKDDFLAMVSHELRGPLASILGWSSVLQSRPVDNDTYRKALDAIERNAKAQNKLLSDLLDIARITAGKLTLEKTSVNVATVAAGVIETIRPAAEAKNIELRYTAGADPGHVDGDPARIQQVFVNLLSNAVKFTPEHGVVSLVIETLDQNVQIEVKDSGIGIGPDLLPHVFERFRQGKSNYSSEGLGLGLAIVRELVELHGGKIEAHSEGQGRGATFTITLPQAGEVQQTNSVQTNERNSLKDIRVLLVEDNADARETLEELLKAYGATVASASSAAEALEKLPSVRPHIVLSDLSMPGQSGFAFIEQVRAHDDESLRSAPAIAVSAFTNIETQRKAFEAGFDAHVGKPVDMAELAQEILKLQPESIRKTVRMR